VADFTALHVLLCFLALIPSKFVVRQVLQWCLWLHRFLSDSHVPSWQICEVVRIQRWLWLPQRLSASLCSLLMVDSRGDRYNSGACDHPTPPL
jgi:hypothetical protein